MRALVWHGVEEWLAEHAQVDLHDDGVAVGEKAPTIHEDTDCLG